jgi:hypothetical protein
MEIKFPPWVKVTKCETRTFKLVVPQSDRYKSTRHGAYTIQTTFPNRPTVMVPRIGLPGFYTKWADGE